MSDYLSDSHFPRLFPRLARRHEINSSSARAWLTPGFGASTAYISLTAGLVCVFDTAEISGVSHQFIGRLGLTAHQAWKSAAHSLMQSCQDEGALGISSPVYKLGDAAPRGVELHCRETSPAAWLTHPTLFNALHRYMQEELRPAHDLMYFSRDQRELFIFDATRAQLEKFADPQHIMSYSVGFPIVSATSFVA